MYPVEEKENEKWIKGTYTSYDHAETTLDAIRGDIHKCDSVKRFLDAIR